MDDESLKLLFLLRKKCYETDPILWQTKFSKIINSLREEGIVTKDFVNSLATESSMVLSTKSLSTSVLHNHRYLSDYNEIKKLGEGAFGQVFLVNNRLDGAKYAIKKIHIDNKNREYIENVLTEIQILAQLSHKHIVRYFTAWCELGDNTHGTHDMQMPDGTTSLLLEDVLSSASSTSAKTTDDTESEKEGEISKQSHKTEFLDLDNLEGFELDLHTTDITKASTVDYDVSGASGGAGGAGAGGAGGAGSEDDSKHYIFNIQIEYCKNGNLAQYLEKRNKINSVEIINYFIQIIKGVKYLHDFGIIHRDINPRNILIDGTSIKISDFGLSTFKDFDRILTSYDGSELYLDPFYKYSGNSMDVYGLGIILVELCYIFKTNMERYAMLNSLKTVKIEGSNTHEVLKHFDPKIRNIVVKCISHDTNERYEDINELYSDIKSLLKDYVV
jgi:serine/threonine protein kinase